MPRKTNTPPSGSAGRKKSTATKTEESKPTQKRCAPAKAAGKSTAKAPSKAAGKPAATEKKETMLRTATGKVPRGRTLTTHDNFLPGGKKTGSTKKRPVVVIEASPKNNLAVVPLSKTSGKNKTHLDNYQQGQSFFKHYVEIEDDEGKPIRINEKFSENSPDMDISEKDTDRITKKVLGHAKSTSENRKKIDKFRSRE